ncbi:MAG: MxaD family protein [Alcanivoracaceae bacterium]|nr:MxaD family protein [Alcanivoracaceae bacterium]MCG8438161.1 SRPBCC family protein [Pseudomonadales bacterium]|tara:strand:- start:1049 stop:1468 length:420 start_codon:yes stop_codon:yes gene_type:complete
MQRIEISKTFPFSVDKLFNFLSDHENLELIFAPAKIQRIKEGKDSPNGVGSTRNMKILIAPAFHETVTRVVPNELIEYTITKGSPLKNHKGVMRFSDTGTGGSRLDYTIEFEGKLPLIGPIIKAGLDQGIRRGLNKLKL